MIENGFLERTNSVKALFRDLSKVKRISTEDEEMYIRVYKDPQSSEEAKQAAKEKIITGNLRYVISMAKRYSVDGEDFNDIFQEGAKSLSAALDDFDLDKGVIFMTFASYYVQRAINQYINTVRPSVVTSNYALQPKIKKVASTFRNENGREPNETELIDLLKSEYGVKIKNVSDLYGAMVTSISEAKDDDDDYHMSDDALFNEKTASMNEYEEQAEAEGLSDTMRVAMQALNDKERKVISMAYGIGFNRSYKDYEIGEEMGYTSERIRQIRKKAESKIKNAYTAVVTR